MAKRNHSYLQIVEDILIQVVLVAQADTGSNTPKVSSLKTFRDVGDCWIEANKGPDTVEEVNHQTTKPSVCPFTAGDMVNLQGA